MNYTIKIREILRDFRTEFLKMIEFKIINSTSVFTEQDTKPYLFVSDNNNMVNSFITIISSNKKEIIAYFTVDAFEIFTSGNVNISFGAGSRDAFFINNIPLNIEPLYSILEDIPHEIADNEWLENL
jgi:hypothetical protein